MAKQDKKEKKPQSPKPPQAKTRRMSRIIERAMDSAKEKKTPRGANSANSGVAPELPPVNAQHKIQGIIFGALTLFLLVSLLTYYNEETSTLSEQGAAQNIAGVVGAMIASVLLKFFGVVAYIFPLLTLLVSIDRFQPTPRATSYGNLAGVSLGIFCLCGLFSLPTLGAATEYSPGGFLGAALASLLLSYLKIFGSITVLITGLIIAGFLLNIHFLRHLLIPEKSEIPIFEEQPTASARVPEIITPQSSQSQEKKELPLPAKRKSLPNLFRKKLTESETEPEQETPVSGQKFVYQLPPPSLLDSPPAEK